MRPLWRGVHDANLDFGRSYVALLTGDWTALLALVACRYERQTGVTYAFQQRIQFEKAFNDMETVGDGGREELAAAGCHEILRSLLASEGMKTAIHLRQSSNTIN